jgi:hypothetical protein
MEFPPAESQAVGWQQLRRASCVEARFTGRFCCLANAADRGAADARRIESAVRQAGLTSGPADAPLVLLIAIANSGEQTQVFFSAGLPDRASLARFSIQTGIFDGTFTQFQSAMDSAGLGTC